MASKFSVEAIFKAVDRITAPVTRMENRVGRFTRKMSAGLRKVNKALNSVVRGLGRGAKAALKFGVVGIGALATAVGLLVREFSKVEDAEASFQPLLGGIEKAKKLVEALNKTAATTPFQFETLAGAANTLLPVMNGNIENVIKTIRQLGDTAGGNAQKLESITRGFTKAMLKGKVDMESLNMIAEAGVPIFTELADTMGVKVNAAFFKMISAGRVTTKQLTGAFEKMTSKGGIFFEGMEIASRTTTGLFSTLRDNISLTAAEVGSVLAPTIKDLIKQATGAAIRVREWVKANRELISSRFIEFVDGIKVAVSNVIDTLKTLNKENNLLARLKDIVVGLSDAFTFLSKHGATILKIVAAVVALSAAVNIATLAMAAFTLVTAVNPFVLIAAAAVGLVVFIDDIIEKFEQMPGVIQAMFTPLKLFLESIKIVKDTLGSIGGAIGSVAFDLFGTPAEAQAAAPQGIAEPQVVSPQDRAATAINEQRTTSTAEVTIKDDTGRAEVTKGKLGTGLRLQQTGAF